MTKTMPKELVFTRSWSYSTDNIIEDILEMANDESMKKEDVSLDLVLDRINDMIWEDVSTMHENVTLRIEDEDGQYIGELS